MKSTNDLKREIEQWRERRSRLSGASLRVSGSLDVTALDPATRNELDKLFEQSGPITVDPRALERTFTIPERNCAISAGVP